MRLRWFGNGEWVVMAALIGELVLFSATAPMFFSVANGVEILRLSVELGLLAIALTPVVITGGIDLSVGAVMGLAAVTFGMAYHDWQLPMPFAAVGALLVGL